MKTAALALLLVTACGSEIDPSMRESIADLYEIDPLGVSCFGSTLMEVEYGRVICRWECVEVQGRTARYLFLDFMEYPEWHLDSVSVEFSRSEQCL